MGILFPHFLKFFIMVIGISGKINSGKDTVGKIIQILVDSPHFSNKGVKVAYDDILTALSVV